MKRWRIRTTFGVVLPAAFLLTLILPWLATLVCADHGGRVRLLGSINTRGNREVVEELTHDTVTVRATLLEDAQPSGQPGLFVIACDPTVHGGKPGKMVRGLWEKWRSREGEKQKWKFEMVGFGRMPVGHLRSVGEMPSGSARLVWINPPEEPETFLAAARLQDAGIKLTIYLGSLRRPSGKSFLSAAAKVGVQNLDIRIIPGVGQFVSPETAMALAPEI